MSRAAVSAVFMLAVACRSSSESQAPIQQDVRLDDVNGCPAVERAVQDAAVAFMRRQLDGYRTSGIGPPMADGAPAATPGDGSKAAAYTTTNVQISGVDEADFVKNDDARMFVLSGSDLFALATWPPAAMALTGNVPFDGWPQGLFLDGERLVVLSQMSPAGDPRVGSGVCLDGPWCGRMGPPTTRVSVLGATDLRSSGEIFLPGALAHSRRIGSVLWLVLADDVRWPIDVRLWPSGPLGGDVQSRVDALAAENERVIRATPLERWLPPAQRRLPDGTTVDLPWDCGHLLVPNTPVRLGFATIARVDLDHPGDPPARVTLLSEPGLVHASRDSLYLASPHWWWRAGPERRDWTYVHRFDLTPPGGPAYVASGGFEGFPVDQFSLDEFEGGLRVAVNTSALNDSLTGFLRSSAVRVLTTEGDRLKVVGELELASGESLYSSRFLGPRGFAVTFRRIDPLFALDLSDASHPRKTGELDLPGYSTYLHPIDDGHLLAIGLDLPGSAPNWRDRSLQLSLFDVSDLSAPRRTAARQVGSAYAWSEAMWDHHAFNWFGEQRLLAIPYFDWQPNAASPWGSFVSELRVFGVGSDSISLVGSLGMRDLFPSGGAMSWRWGHVPWIRRSVMASDASGTYVYAISDVGVRVARSDALAQPIQTVAFPHPK